MGISWTAGATSVMGAFPTVIVKSRIKLQGQKEAVTQLKISVVCTDVVTPRLVQTLSSNTSENTILI